MADVSIRVETTADTRGAAETGAALKRLEEGLDKVGKAAKQSAENTSRMEAVFREVAVRGLGLMKDLAVQAVASAFESERAVTRLRRVAGEATEAFQRQAAAIQQQLNVSDEYVLGLQEMALRFEVAPSRVDELTRAVLDYSKATGLDADGAMRRLLLGLEAGGEGLARMGVEMKSTGNKAADLSEAVRQLQERWGGAAAADAATLAGRVEGLKVAFDELLESVGALALVSFVEFDVWYGNLVSHESGIKAVTQALNELAEASSEERWRTLLGASTPWGYFFGAAQSDASLRADALVAAQDKLYDAKKKLAEFDKAYEGQGLDALAAQLRPDVEALVARAQAEVDKAKAAIDAAKGAQAGGGGALKGPVHMAAFDAKALKADTEAVKKAAKERAEAQKKASVEAYEVNQRILGDMAEMADAHQAVLDERLARELEAGAKEAQARMDSERAVVEALEWGAQEQQRVQEENLAEQARAQLEHGARMREEAQRQQQETQALALRGAGIFLNMAGDIVGGMRRAREKQADAMAALNEKYREDMEEAQRYTGEKSEALGREALEKLQKGMKAATKEAEFNPMDVIKAAIPGIIELALSAYAPTAPLAPIVGGAVRLLMQSFHEGGWVGDNPGAARERPAMLLDGERVLSHQEVRAMGGPSAVDAAAQGAGGGATQVSLHVSTLDAASFRDWMTVDGGRGFARAMRTGQGEAAQLVRRLSRR